MILHDFKCEEAHRFEAGIASMHADNPDCPACGSPTTRLLTTVKVGGTASAGASREEMPKSWTGMGSGHPDAVSHWRKKMVHREKLEEKYPELGGDRRPVLAHEGIFRGRPLRAGDDIGASVKSASAAAAGQTTPAAAADGSPGAAAHQPPTASAVSKKRA